MRAATPLGHLFPRAAHGAPTRGHTLGAPRLYDTFVDLFFLGRRRATYQRLVDAASVQRDQQVLDVGCGTGYLARLLARAVGPGGQVVGIDPSAEMVEYAARRGGRASNLRFQLGTAEALPFPSDQFHVVVTSLMLHHLPEDLRVPALREMYRVLRPGGTLLVAEAQMPRSGVLRLLGRLHDFDRMASLVPELAPLAEQAGFVRIRAGEAPPWLRYIRAIRVAEPER
jgi:ubiquinone/menaquinone biosynthesis C-methylase UbiE